MNSYIYEAEVYTIAALLEMSGPQLLGLISMAQKGTNIGVHISKQVHLAYLVVGIPKLILCTSLILLTVLLSIGHVPLSC